MRAALALARRGVGNTWPNPSVGCVIVKRRPGGRPGRHRAGRPAARRDRGPGDGGRGGAGGDGLRHARTLLPLGPDAALHRRADRRRRRRVVIAVRDPDPRVDGAGIARLRAAGIAVEEGMLPDEAAEMIAGFPQPDRAGPSAGDAEARLHPRRPDRDPAGREPLDHRGGGARAAHALRGRNERSWSASAPC